MLTLISPAKINLFLKVVRHRPDGYHDLASLFQAISLYDTIHFTLSNQDQLTCTKSGIPTDDSNLILKAVHLFRRKTGLQFGLKAHLEKNIPHEAGLGGGSSNAATTLWALNQLHGQPATLNELIAWSGEIGSDITFFLSQGTAYCTGRGEIMESLAPLPKQKLWIAKPPEGLSTPAVFKALDLNKLIQRDPLVTLSDFYRGNFHYFNDLEETAFQLKPHLKEIRKKLLELGFEKVVMTGSGTAFFCVGSNLKPNLPHMNGSDSNSFPLEARKNKGAILENMAPLFSEPLVRASREKITSNMTAFIGGKLGLNPMSIPGLNLFPVHFLNRESNHWYSLDI